MSSLTPLNTLGISKRLFNIFVCFAYIIYYTCIHFFQYNTLLLFRKLKQYIMITQGVWMGKFGVNCTAMRIIKLNLFPVPVRYRYIEMSSFSHHVLLYLRTLYIVWSLVRRRVARRLTRFQTMHNVLKNSKIL